MRNFAKYRIVFLSFLILTFSLAGCRTLRAPSNPHKEWTPPDWEKTHRSGDSVWQSIRERRVDTSHPLALVELVAIAVKKNPALREAWESAREAEAEGLVTKAEAYPTLTGSADITHRRRLSTRKANNLNDITYGPSADLSYVLLDFGGKGAAVQEAVQTLLAANFSFSQAFQDMLLDVEKSYYGLYSDESALKAAQADVENAQQAYNLAQQKYKVGLAARLDVLQAKSDYDDTLFLLEEAKGNAKTAKADLAQTLGLFADTRFEISAPTKELPTHISDIDITRLIDEALARRPDIAAQRATLRAKQAALKEAASDLAPRLSVGANVNANWYDYYNSWSGTDVARDWGYSGFLKIDWDIFNMSTIGAKRNAEAEARVQREALAQAEIEASADVWTKFYTYRTAVRKLTFSRAFLETAEESSTLALESYKAGLKSILDVLQAQSKLSEARSKLVQSEEDLYIAIAELAHATGTLYVESYGVAITKAEE